MTTLRRVVCVLLLTVTVAGAGTGELDPTFGGTGLVTSDLGAPPTAPARAVAIQPDGRIVVVGSLSTGLHDDLAIIRYLTDGTPDASFGTGGVVTLDFGGTHDWITGSALVQPDGRIVVWGQVGIPGLDGALVRFEPDGALDVTFGSGGIVGIPGMFGYGRAALQPDGRIVVASDCLAGQLCTARVDSSGALDPTWGGTGIAWAPLCCASETTSLALQPDGKVVVTGHTGGALGADVATIARYDGGGTLDPTFGSGGLVVDPSLHVAQDVALLPDGRMLVLAYRRDVEALRVMRLHPDGTGDATFGDGGPTAYRIGVDGGFWRRLLVEPDGRIVVAGTEDVVPGSSLSATPFTAGLVRLLPDGTLDARFGMGGRAIVPGGFVLDVARQTDGRLVAVGSTGIWTDLFLTVRYDGDCPALPDTDGDGIGDACDPCTGGVVPARAVLQFRGLDLLPGDDTMRFVGSATLPGAPVDPLADGVRLIVQNALGDTLADTFVPPGAFDDGLQVGWSVDGTGSRFTYKSRHPTERPFDDVTAAKLKRLATPGAVKVKVQTADAGYAVGAGNLPYRATLVFGPPFADDGRCLEIEYPGPSPAPACRTNATATTVRCR